jgi:hypothetical protein
MYSQVVVVFPSTANIWVNYLALSHCSLSSLACQGHHKVMRQYKGVSFCLHQTRRVRYIFSYYSRKSSIALILPVDSYCQTKRPPPPIISIKTLNFEVSGCFCSRYTAHSITETSLKRTINYLRTCSAKRFKKHFRKLRSLEQKFLFQ